MLGIAVTLACITLSIVAAPAERPMFHFGENGAVTALSSVFMAMSSAIALAVFYLRIELMKAGSWFWLVLAAGLAFLAIDEQIMLHERGGALLEGTVFGPSEFFRNWNDLIVMGYGVGALALIALSAREVFQCRPFAALFGMAFAFYAVHTGLDSVLPSTLAWKDIPEESAKLFCALFLFLSVSARFLSQVAPMKTAMPHQD